MNYPEQYDIIIIGGGHAAYGAAQVCSLMKMKTVMITPDIDKIGYLSCNVSMGGIGRGQLMRENDALGISANAICTDLSATNLAILNRSKGPAMHSHHAIVDKELYRKSVLALVQSLPYVSIFQQAVEDIIIENNKAVGVITNLGIKVRAKAVLMCAGTFLNGKIHVGMDNYSGGRAGEAAATTLGERLKELNLPQGRMKTGTPPRIDGRTIDFLKLAAKWGDGVEDGNLPVFSFMGDKSMHPKQLPCWITHTNKNTHDILRSGFDRSPFIQEHFEGKGPRYCPSIEDKITRFTDKESHQIILEPEGINTFEYYPNGISTSLPFDIQIEAIRSMAGLENALITRPGYAVEYDYYDPRAFKQTFEFKEIENLYAAGVPVGTSGYSEANSVGNIAAINACLKLKDLDSWIPQRHDGYLGVLVDDLTTQGVNEPYRMFTSRAEYRLQLREDNADARLTPIGRELGLVDDIRWEKFCRKQEAIALAQEKLKSTYINPAIVSNEEAMAHIGSEIKQAVNLSELLKRPETSFDKIISMKAVQEKLPELQHEALVKEHGEKLATEICEQVEILHKYSGYIKQQNMEIEKMSDMQSIKLPLNFDYSIITALGTEAQQVLNKNKPETIGQASRMPGVTTSSINILLIYLKKNKLMRT